MPCKTLVRLCMDIVSWLLCAGAGKTSTLKMLTGEVVPDSGDAFLGGHSIVADINECRRLVGNCPQFDPILVRLTPREHLQLFAKIKVRVLTSSARQRSAGVAPMFCR